MKTNPLLHTATALLMMGGAADALLAADELLIQNEALAVRCDSSGNRVQFVAKPSQHLFASEVGRRDDGATAKIAAVSHKTFGTGQAIEITLAGGERESVMLFPRLPFALIRSALRNATDSATVTRNVDAFSARLDLGAPAVQLKTLGTGGLLAPDKNPGSYVWLAVAEPQSRRGVVFGWLTHERGSGVVFSKTDGEAVRVEARLDYGRLRLAPGRTEELETLALGYFDDARLGLEAWADAVAKVHDVRLPEQPAGYCTWYSQPYGGASDEKHIAELARFAATNLAPFGFSVVQIDDHWQAGLSTNGPKRNFTTHAAKGPYPSGMKAAAEQIKSLGLTPGLWFMPFAGTYYDPFFAGHQDWFARRADGSPYETAWGGTCLDMTHPDAREHLRDVVRRIAHEWGYTYFKMDGLWTGTATRQQYVNSGYKEDGMGDAVLHNPEKTNLEAYRDGLRLVRETAGRNVFFLGCCAPQNMRSYGGAFGLVDAMRIGPDNGSDWKGLLRGPIFGSRHYFLHGRVWYNDPDPVYVRAKMPLHHAQLICSWVALTGQLNLSSEWLPDLPAERLDILKHTMPSHGLRPRPADLFEHDPPRLWLLTDSRREPRREVVGIFNWEAQELAVDCPLDWLGLESGGEYLGFDFWTDTSLPPIKGRLQVKVPPQSCRILALRPRAGHPQLLSTSRHITQGVVDVIEEVWDTETRVLRGRSRIVANGPYELRIALQGDGAGRIRGVSVSPPDQRAGVRISHQQTGDLIRVMLNAPVSRDVSWRVQRE